MSPTSSASASHALGAPPGGGVGAAPELLAQAGTLVRGAAMVESAQQELSAVGRTLHGDAAALQGQWSGQGGAAFAALAVAWQERQGRVVAALGDLAASLRATEAALSDADARQAQTLGALQAALGSMVAS